MKLTLIFASLFLLQHNLYAIDPKTNLELRELEFQKRENVLNRKINRSSYLPKISLESGFEFNKEHPNFENESGPLLYLQLKQNIFSGGKNYYESKVINLENERIKLLTQIKERDIKLDSIKLLAEIKTLENKLGIIKTEASENLKLKAMVLRKIAAGLSSNSETIEFETNEIAISDKALIVEHDLLKLKEELLKKYSYQYSFEELKKDLEFNNIELSNDHKAPIEEKLNQLNLKRNELIVSKVKTDYYPTIDLEAKAGHITAANNYEFSNTKEYQVAINFSLPLFSGGETYYELQKEKNNNRLEKNRTDVEAMSIKNNLDLDLKKLNLVKAQIKNSQNIFAKNVKHFEMIQSEFKRGIKEGSDLLRALSELTEAKMKLIELESELTTNEAKIKLYYQY